MRARKSRTHEKAKNVQLVDVYWVMLYVWSLTTNKTIMYNFWDMYLCSEHTKSVPINYEHQIRREIHSEEEKKSEIRDFKTDGNNLCLFLKKKNLKQNGRMLRVGKNGKWVYRCLSHHSIYVSIKHFMILKVIRRACVVLSLQFFCKSKISPKVLKNSDIRLQKAMFLVLIRRTKDWIRRLWAEPQRKSVGWGVLHSHWKIPQRRELLS